MNRSEILLEKIEDRLRDTGVRVFPRSVGPVAIQYIPLGEDDGLRPTVFALSTSSTNIGVGAGVLSLDPGVLKNIVMGFPANDFDSVSFYEALDDNDRIQLRVHRWNHDYVVAYEKDLQALGDALERNMVVALEEEIEND